MTVSKGMTKVQSTILVLLRIIVGWHLLYEGIAKLVIPGWTSAPYLENSRWIFAGLFNWMAANDGVLQVVDFLNIWGLILIGIGLMLGCMTRIAGIAGVSLLSFYYLANPPFLGTDFGVPQEGHYLFFNKTFVEIIALLLLIVFPSGLYFGIDRFIKVKCKAKKSQPKPDKPESKTLEEWAVPDQIHRREVLRYLTMIPVLGAFAWGAVRKYRWNQINAVTGATI